MLTTTPTPATRLSADVAQFMVGRGWHLVDLARTTQDGVIAWEPHPNTGMLSIRFQGDQDSLQARKVAARLLAEDLAANGFSAYAQIHGYTSNVQVFHTEA